MSHIEIKASEQNLEDLRSAVGYFLRKYPGGAAKNPSTFRAMGALDRKLIAALKKLLKQKVKK